MNLIVLNLKYSISFQCYINFPTHNSGSNKSFFVKVLFCLARIFGIPEFTGKKVFNWHLTGKNSRGLFHNAW